MVEKFNEDLKKSARHKLLINLKFFETKRPPTWLVESLDFKYT